MFKGLRLFAVGIIAVSAASCAAPTSRVSENASFQWTSASKRILLVKPDVELGELTAGGAFEVRADWTTSASGLIQQNIANYFSKKSAEVVSLDTLSDAKQVQLVKLHGAVGRAVQTHLYVPGLALPNKGKALDWSIGTGANVLRDAYGADYALFVFVRDSYATAGRALFMIGAAMFGVGVPGGQQVGFASLVDLRTGNIVWFNQLARSSGDLRTEVPAQKTVDILLTGLPL